MIELTLSLQTDSPTPLYQQLYEELCKQIRDGRIPQSTRLPGKRTLAAHLSISVNTVDTAYQMLLAEGYVESRERSGFFVLPVPVLFPSAAISPSTPSTPPPTHWRFDCGTGTIDTALFPFHTWGKIQRDLLYNNPEFLLHGNRQGDENLRTAIADYLRSYRGVQCTVDQVVIGAGVEYLLGLVAQLLHGREAAVEHPGYERSRTILENNSLHCLDIPIDENGLRVDALAVSNARLCYVTPSHHFPTAVTMPIGRRAQLLQWSIATGGFILEDDYDAEFRFDMRPIPSLQGMAGADGRVVYLCTFSKSLAPGIRIACMVLPACLMPAYRQRFGHYANTVSRVEQQTLCRFLTGGHFTRHLARMRAVYHRKMKTLVAALEAAFAPQALRIEGLHTGLHLMVTLPNGPSEDAMVTSARKAGIHLAGLSTYYRTPSDCPPHTVIISYAGLPENQLEELALLLHQAWTNPVES